MCLDNLLHNGKAKPVPLVLSCKKGLQYPVCIPLTDTTAGILEFYAIKVPFSFYSDDYSTSMDSMAFIKMFRKAR